MQFFKTLALLLSAVSFSSAALDSARLDEAADRGLVFLGARGCTKRLATCRNANQVMAGEGDSAGDSDSAGTSVFNNILNALIEYIGNIDGDPNDSIVSDLVDFLLNAGSINFETIEEDISLMMLDVADDAMDQLFLTLQKTTSDVVQQFVAPNLEGAIRGSVGFVGSVVRSSAGPLIGQVAPPILQVLNLLEATDAVGTITAVITGATQAAQEAQAAADTTTAIPTSQATQVALRDINQFMGTMAGTAISLGIPRSESSQQEVNACAAKLVQCEYETLILEVAPLVVGEVVLAQAMNDANRRRRDLEQRKQQGKN